MIIMHNRNELYKTWTCYVSMGYRKQWNHVWEIWYGCNKRCGLWSGWMGAGLDMWCEWTGMTLWRKSVKTGLWEVSGKDHQWNGSIEWMSTEGLVSKGLSVRRWSARIRKTGDTSGICTLFRELPVKEQLRRQRYIDTDYKILRVEVRWGGASHLHIVTAKHKEKSIKTQPNEVENHHHLNGTFGP